MDTLEEIIIKNYKLVKLMNEVQVWTTIIKHNSKGERIVYLAKDSSRKCSQRILNRIEADGKKCPITIDGHPEFDERIGMQMYVVMGNVIGVAFELQYRYFPKSVMKKLFIDYLFRAWLYDTIMSTCNNGVMYGRKAFFTRGEQYEITTNVDLHGIEQPWKKNVDFLLQYFKNDYEKYVSKFKIDAAQQ